MTFLLMQFSKDSHLSNFYTSMLFSRPISYLPSFYSDSFSIVLRETFHGPYTFLQFYLYVILSFSLISKASLEYDFISYQPIIRTVFILHQLSPISPSVFVISREVQPKFLNYDFNTFC